MGGQAGTRRLGLDGGHEELAVLLPPGINALQSLPHVKLRLPAGIAVQARIVGDVDELVAGARGVEVVFELAPGEGLDVGNEFQLRNGALRTAADVVNAAARSRKVLTDSVEGAQQVGD